MLVNKLDLNLLPKKMHDSLALIPFHTNRLVLLTRHSIREEASNQHIAGYHLALTEDGRKLALAWGATLADALLPHRITQCMSSPVQRCVDTADLLLDGFYSQQPDSTTTNRANVSVQKQALLVEPGSFVQDVEQAGPIFLQQGALNFINSILNNSLPGVKLPVQAVKDILQMLFESCPIVQHQMLLAVSHDTILAALLAVLDSKTSITWDDWPEMMEGVFLWFTPKQEEDERSLQPSSKLEESILKDMNLPNVENALESNNACNFTVDFESSKLHWIWRGIYRQLHISDLLVSDY